MSAEDFCDSFQCETSEAHAESTEKCSDILYNGTKISVLQYHSIILQYSLKHCLSKTAVNDLLTFIADLLPRPNKAARSIYRHEKFFSVFEKQSFIEKHQFCTLCHHLFDETETLCPNECISTIENFLICDIESQIQSALSGIYIAT